jgi:seryl-tRNA synthetase
MLDIKFIRQHAHLVQDGAKAKHFNIDIQELLDLDAEIKPIQQELENMQAQRNKISKALPLCKEEEEKTKLREAVLSLKSKMELLETDLNSKKSKLKDLMLLVPQPPLPEVPRGKDDSENVEIRRIGTVPTFDFEPVDHITLGEELGIIDIERGVKIAGSRSYILKGNGALLEQALLRYTYDKLVKKGFTPMSVPVLVGEKAMEGTGYFPLGRDQAYFIEKDRLALVGTAEVSLCSLHSDEVFNATQLPIRYMSQTACFRREAGTYGKDTKGLYRVHQFQKIEMVIIAPADKNLSDELHAELLDISEQLLQDFGLAYRVVNVCAGDLGQGQVKKNDIETWMPSRKGYGETHSCSSFYDFQARRLGIHYKDKEGTKHVAYTLNNTAIAAPRVILAILENFQTRERQVVVPECLRPYMGGKTHL